MDGQTEKLIVERVLELLADRTGLPKALSATPAAAGFLGGGEEAPLTLDPPDRILVENPHNPQALALMRASTPARIGIGRSGARQRAMPYLNFLADHAAAMDAVFMDVSDEFLDRMGLTKVQTIVKDKDEYLMRPDLGKILSEEAKATIADKVQKGAQAQIIVVDGLSSSAIEANVPDLLPALTQGLKAQGLSVGQPFFVRYGRVGIEDEIARLLGCDVIIELVGERPGLVTAESMSAYMIYRPSAQTVEADRTVMSNIHRGGTAPVEAGAHLATLVKTMIDLGASGVALSDLLKTKN